VLVLEHATGETGGFFRARARARGRARERERGMICDDGYTR